MLRLKRSQSLQSATTLIRSLEPEIVPGNVPQFVRPFALAPAAEGTSRLRRRGRTSPTVPSTAVHHHGRCRLRAAHRLSEHRAPVDDPRRGPTPRVRDQVCAGCVSMAGRAAGDHREPHIGNSRDCAWCPVRRLGQPVTALPRCRTLSETSFWISLSTGMWWLSRWDHGRDRFDFRDCAGASRLASRRHGRVEVRQPSVIRRGSQPVLGLAGRHPDCGVVDAGCRRRAARPHVRRAGGRPLGSTAIGS